MHSPPDTGQIGSAFIEYAADSEIQPSSFALSSPKVIRRPPVSIGLPVYNGARHVRRALDSLLSQTFTDFELIISDNLSTDDTWMICMEYAERDTRIRCVRQHANQGVMSNFRIVLNEAVGEYFMWAAADDRWDANWVATLLKGFGPGISLTFGSVLSFLHNEEDGKLAVLRTLAAPRTFRMIQCYFWSEWGEKPNAVYGLYRTDALRRAFNEVLGTRGDFRVCLDNLLLFKVLESGGLRVDAATTFYKRGRTPTTRYSGTGLLTMRRVWRAFAILLKFDYLPYLTDHIRYSPPGITRFVVLAATPVKYLWMVGRGVGPAVLVFARFLSYAIRQWYNALKTTS
jgi:glycosyltransferase involved in cell wall biosynthesis